MDVVTIFNFLKFDRKLEMTMLKVRETLKNEVLERRQYFFFGTFRHRFGTATVKIVGVHRVHGAYMALTDENICTWIKTMPNCTL